jgi:hypothetical protein
MEEKKQELMMRKVVLVSMTFIGILICGLAMASVASCQPFLINGSHWSEIAYDAKVMYVKGVGNMADFECQAGALNKGRSFCLASTLVKELQARSIDSVVKEIDQYYKDNPNKLNTSVLEVMLRRADKVCPPETPKK